MKLGTILKIAGVVLIVAALCLVGYNLLESKRAEKASEMILEQLLPEIKEPPAAAPTTEEDPASPDETTAEPQETEIPEFIVNPRIDMPAAKVNEISYIGVLDIQPLGLKLPVAENWSYPILKKTPARYSGSAYLDDLIILAHNYDHHFGRLNQLKSGDKIKFTDIDGNVFTYSVVEVDTLKATAIEEMESGDWDLTLFTCTLGGQSRVTVRCEKDQ